MASAGVKSTITGRGADLFVRGNLPQQAGQHGAVALSAGGEFHGADVAGGCVHHQMNLSILTPAMGAVLSRQPFTIAGKLYPRAVGQQVQHPRCPAMRELNRDYLLPAAQGRRHRPVEASHPQDTGDHPGRLPKRQPVQNLHHWPTRMTNLRGAPSHVLVQAGQQRPALLKGLVSGRRVRRAVTGGLSLAHQLDSPSEPRRSQRFATMPGASPQGSWLKRRNFTSITCFDGPLE